MHFFSPIGISQIKSHKKTKNSKNIKTDCKTTYNNIYQHITLRKPIKLNKQLIILLA